MSGEEWIRNKSGRNVANGRKRPVVHIKHSTGLASMEIGVLI